MAQSVHEVLRSSGVLQQVVLPPGIELMLKALELAAAPQPHDGGVTLGKVILVSDLSKSPVPGFDFALALPAPGIEVPYKLRLEAAAFQFWLELGGEEHLAPVFDLVRGVPGFALRGAEKVTGPDGRISLKPLPDTDPLARPRLVCASAEAGAALVPSLLVSGTAAEPAGIRFTPDTDSAQGVVPLGLRPPTVVFGDSGIGFDLIDGLVLDDSTTVAGPGGPGAPGMDPPVARIDADDPAWRGIVARRIDFYLPSGVPLFGGRAIRGYLELPRGTGAAGGVHLVVESTVPATTTAPVRPGYSVRIECLDPTASGISGLVPTLISATMDLPLDGATGRFTESGHPQAFSIGAGKPVRATASFARDPVNAPGQARVTVGVSAQGDDGIVSVESRPDDTAAKIFTTAAALATALIADRDVARDARVGDTSGVVLPALLAAGKALSSLFEDRGRFVLHGVQIESSGHGAPIGDAVVLTLDYSVAVQVTKLDVGALAVSMRPEQPMRIRVRDARMSLDLTRNGLDMVGLDFDRAAMEIEDPGAWNVEGLTSLFDVLRSRSGRGSSWIEVDLGFKVDLGPITVSGATVRGELNADGTISASLRGLEAGLDVPGAITGSGSVRPLRPKGFAAALRADIHPLNLAAFASVLYAPPKVLLRLGIDLPAPIPLANSGFGLMGVGGLLGFSLRPDYDSAPGGNAVEKQLQWKADDENAFVDAPGASAFGLEVAVGTLPDLGFTLSAKAGLLISTPDVAVRASLNGRVLQPAAKLSDPSWPPPVLISYLGLLSVDEDAIAFALLGLANLKPLMEVRVPITGRFPFGDPSRWFVYLGADGAPIEDRGTGPISATVLPDFIPTNADAYLMARGSGITDWPNGHRLLSVADGQVVAFGFAVQTTFGIKPLLYAELHAGLDLLLATRPPTFAGFGHAGGSLHLGPFSLGVEAQVTFTRVGAASYLWAQVTGRIELFFFDVEGTVTISFGDREPALALPPPDRHPLDRVDAAGDPAGSLGVLTDDSYQVLAPLVDDPVAAAAHVVWPDAAVALPFAVPPQVEPGAGSQFPAVLGPGTTPAPTRLGTEMIHHTWHLDGVTLRDVTDEADPRNGTGTAPPGQLAARWQVPRGGPGRSDVSELVLLSTGPDLWVNRLADGGQGSSGGNPLQAGSDHCHPGPDDPDPGWAIGLLAVPLVPGWRLPAEFVSADPRVCRVEARMHLLGLLPSQGDLVEVPLDAVHALPEPYRVEPAALAAWRQEGWFEHRFTGQVLAPALHGAEDPSQRVAFRNGTFVGQRTRLEPTEPITRAVLVLSADPAVVDDLDVPVPFRVFDDLGQEWERDNAYSGDSVFVYRPGHGEPMGAVSVQLPLNARLGVLGLGGVTVSAQQLAEAERARRKDESDRRRKAAAEGPPATAQGAGGQGVGPHRRGILRPWRLYRVDVAMSWSGSLARQNKTGQLEVVQTVAHGDPVGSTYQGGRSTRRQLFFRTAPVAISSPVSSPNWLLWFLTLHDEFDPRMLERYLAGYEPAQSEEYRFLNDPLRAHFTQDHVAALADAYGFRMQVAVRRVDRAGPDNARPQLLTPGWSYATDPAFLSLADRLRHDFALASGCPQPTPGATATVSTGLAPLAWYETFVRVGAVIGTGGGDLPGVTFRTSRWADPLDMLRGLGLAAGGQPARAVPAGDLEIPGGGLPAGADPVPGTVLDDDQAFENALLQLGLEGWPAVGEPRLSRLWQRSSAGTWLFAGVLLESPEPVHRPGRFTVTDLQGKTLLGAPETFAVRRRDRLGARLLFLTAPPAPELTTRSSATAAMFPSLTLRGAVPPGRPGAGPVTATLDLPPEPSFAREPR